MRLSPHFARIAALIALPTAAVAQAAQQGTQLPLKHAPQPTTAAITPGDLMTRLYIFADDSMEGRETGTRGHVKSTDYIARELKALGLKPMGDNGGYIQNVPVIRRALDPASTITVEGTTLKAGTDFIATSRGNFREVASASVVFAGSPLDSAPPFSAEQARGKIVLVRAAGGGFFGAGGRGGGGGGGGRGGRGGGGAMQRFNEALSGAAAIATIADTLVAAQVQNALRPREGDVFLKPAAEAPAAPLTLTVTRHAAEVLLGAPIDGAARGQDGKSVKASVKFIDTPAPARNVVAAYEGHDPKLKNEWVAMGAHDDHIGILSGPGVDHDSLHLYNQAAYPIREKIAAYNLENHICGGRLQTGCTPATPEQQAKLDELQKQLAAIRINMDSVHRAHPARRDSVRNGADDDGSGSVTLLEIAERFAKEKPQTKRSILFVWHTGEEKGLWGSRYVTDHPPVPRDSIVAQLNMDMVGRGAASDLMEGSPNYLQLVGSRRLSTELGDLVESLNKKENPPFTFDYQFDANGHPENIYCRSDHANYARFGIPVVFVTTGLHGDYHQVTDEPQYIDYAHMAHVGNFMYTLATHVADMDHRPLVDKPRPDPTAPCRQ